MKRLPTILWLLFALFCFRVIGQLVISVWKVDFLPPMEEWYSGLLPYRILLPAQLAIIVLMAAINWQFSRGAGWWLRPRRGLGSVLNWFGWTYLIVMLVRYSLRMALYAPERWTGGSIPIFFHVVLAVFLLIIGRYHAGLIPAKAARPRRYLKAGGIAVIGFGIAVWSLYLLAPAILGKTLGFTRPQYAVRVERSVTMRTSDGIDLAADIYHPVRAGAAPTILVRIPYSRTIENRLFATTIGRMWAEHGYQVVFQGTRGRYESGGTYQPLIWERKDGIETLQWLSRQPWFDGRAGMWGGSYFGYTQWVLADQTNPGLSALFVQIASTSFYDTFYAGGAFALESALYWALRSGGPEDVAVSEDDLDRGHGFPLIETDDRASRDVSFFNDWVSHPNRDAYWQVIDGDGRWATLQAPILLQAGWFDPFLPGQLSDFVHIRAEAKPDVAQNTRLIIGPWTHAFSPQLPDGYQPRNYRFESLAPSIPWFDRFLKKDAPAAHFPPVRLFVLGENVWRAEQEWPLARTVYTPWFLAGSESPGRLGTAAAESSQMATYAFDPAHPVPSAGGAMLGPRAGMRLQNSSPRHDVLSFATDPLDDDMEITGPISAILHVRSTAPSADFVVTLMDVYPDGRAYNISEGILRRSYAGDTTRIDVALWPTSILVQRGHSLRLQITSSWTPRFDVNPNAATQTIFWGGETPSRIVLPVIPRQQENSRGRHDK